MATPAVREATPVDADTLAAFLMAAWREAGPDSPGFAGATPELMAEIATPAVLRARIGPGGRRMFIAVDGAAIVGFAATRPLHGGVAELAGIIVARSASGRGLGTELVRAATEAARADGHARMIVRTERTNAAAIAFYRARGFAPTGETVESVGALEIPVLELAATLPSTSGPARAGH
jgi:ribosomal protein S18 acetylase RimI-like enzyme